MTVAELNKRMSAREFSEWMEFACDEPFGPVRDNLHAGIIAATVYNVSRGKNRRAMSPSDFLLKTEQERMAERTRKTMTTMKAIATSGKKKGKK